MYLIADSSLIAGREATEAKKQFWSSYKFGALKSRGLFFAFLRFS